MSRSIYIGPYKVLKIYRNHSRREVLARGLSLDDAQKLVRSKPDSNTHMVIYTKQFTAEKYYIEPFQLTYEQVVLITKSLLTTGGASYRPSTGELNPVTGYMCALVGFEKQVPRVWNMFDLQQVLNEWLSEIQYTGESAAFIGLWENDGTLYLDLSQHFVDRNKAIAMGHQRNQLTIWDCANKCEIKTS